MTQKIDEEWKPADEQMLRDLWAAGESASLIGAKMKRTRNAIIGKAHRMNLTPRRTNPIKAARTGQIHRKVAPLMAGNVKSKAFILGDGPKLKLAPPLPTRAEAFMSLPGSSPVGITEITGCRWPVGESPVLFCNLERHPKPAKPGQPAMFHVYCEVHHKLARSKTQ